MEKSVAKAILRELAEIGIHLNNLTHLTQEMLPEEGRLIRRMLAVSYFNPDFDITMHIVRLYPDLYPDKKA